MKERPILFSGPMVRAILDGRKTQSRRTSGLNRINESYYRDRIEKIECRDGLWHFWERGHGSSALPVFTAKCPFGQPGDRLWVRETWGPCAGGVVYRADEGTSCPDGGKWAPSIHMPRWTSRITLEITAVRVERLGEIGGRDSIAEGIEPTRRDIGGATVTTFRDYLTGATDRAARQSFETLWRSIYGPKSWDPKLWVWVVKFRRVEI